MLIWAMTPKEAPGLVSELSSSIEWESAIIVWVLIPHLQNPCLIASWWYNVEVQRNIQMVINTIANWETHWNPINAKLYLQWGRDMYRLLCCASF